MEDVNQFINKMGWENPFTQKPITCQAEYYQYLDMQKAANNNEDLFSGKFSIQNYINMPLKDVDTFISEMNWTNDFTGEKILTLEDYKKFLKMYDNKKNTCSQEDFDNLINHYFYEENSSLQGCYSVCF